MLYMLLICENESEAAARSAGEDTALARAYDELSAALAAAGKYRGCGALEPTRTATTIRVRTGKTLVTDGPFAETREQLGGYYLIEANDLDDAIAIAARLPGASVGSIEVRPVRSTENP
jgi:hypothetical protein